MEMRSQAKSNHFDLPLLAPGDLLHFAWNYAKVESGCWEWFAGCSKEGYGRYSYKVNGKKVQFKAHRLSFYNHYKIQPGDLLVLHKCDNPPCVNPDHLFLGTDKDKKDCANKGRTLDSQDVHFAKLTWDLVNYIRTEHARGFKNQTDLAKETGVNRHSISHVITGKTWNRNQG